MAAVGAEFVSGLISTSQQRAQQTAVQLADSAMEQIRALHPSDLVTGRDSTSVTTQFTAAPRPSSPGSPRWTAFDSQATAQRLDGAIPTAPFPQKPGTIWYTLNEYLGWCSIRTTGSTACVPPSRWPGQRDAFPAGSRCGRLDGNSLRDVGVHLRHVHSHQHRPRPHLPDQHRALHRADRRGAGNQSIAVNDTVSLQLAVQTEPACRRSPGRSPRAPCRLASRSARPD